MKLLWVIGLWILILLFGCAPKRWYNGDPRRATPAGTPEIIKHIEIQVGR